MEEVIAHVSFLVKNSGVPPFYLKYFYHDLIVQSDSQVN